MALKSGVSGSVRRRVFRRDAYRCLACGLQGREHRWASGAFTYPTDKPGIYLSIDHKHPRSKGGSNDEANLQTYCTRCNLLKGAKVSKAEEGSSHA